MVEGYVNYSGLDVSNVLIIWGVDEGIELFICIFCILGKDNILICFFIYGMYVISVEICDVGVKKVVLNDDFSLNVNVICVEEDVNIIFICVLNNLMGMLVVCEDIKIVLEYFVDIVLVVVDEVYIEFDVSNIWVIEIVNYMNFVVFCMLLKVFVLVGLCCGFIFV